MTLSGKQPRRADDGFQTGEKKMRAGGAVASHSEEPRWSGELLWRAAPCGLTNLLYEYHPCSNVK